MPVKRRKAPNAPSVHDVGSAGEIWRRLLQSENIQPKYYDEDIVISLCRSLNLGDDCSAFVDGRADLGKALDDAGTSREEFIFALFGAAQPFADMMAQLCSFFERHSVRGTDQTLRMEFEFDEPGRELIFDLKHFREFLSEWDKVEGMVDTDCWDMSSLWSLVRAISPDIDPKAHIDDGAAQEWIAANFYPAREHASNHWASPPQPPDVGVSEVDAIVRRIFSTLVAIGRSCSPFDNYGRLLAEAGALDQRSPQTGSMKGTPGNAVPIVEWDMRSLRLLESDFFTAALMRSLWDWVEKLQNSPAAGRRSVAQPVLSRLQALFGATPTKRAPGEIDLERLLSFLRLPIWKERPALYAAWMMPVIEQALHGYPLQIHAQDQTLRFSFKSTRMATFESSGGPITLVAEHRAPLEKPCGEGRTDHVQPDYVLFAGKAQGREDARLVLELKQYVRPNVKVFSDALIDYARAYDRAGVLLADYGPMSPAVIKVVPPDLASRVAALGDVRPGNARQILDLQQRIRAAVPPPSAAGALQAPQAAAIVIIDVSGSMREILTWPAVREALGDLASANPGATWVAVDTTVRGTFTGPEALERILALEMSNSTELTRIVTEYESQRTVVVTDSDGEAQLRRTSESIGRIGLASSRGIEWAPATTSLGSSL